MILEPAGMSSVRIEFGGFDAMMFAEQRDLHDAARGTGAD